MAKKTVKKKVDVKTVVKKVEEFLGENVSQKNLIQEVQKLNQRIDRIVDAIDKSKKVKGL